MPFRVMNIHHYRDLFRFDSVIIVLHPCTTSIMNRHPINLHSDSNLFISFRPDRSFHNIPYRILPSHCSYRPQPTSTANDRLSLLCQEELWSPTAMNQKPMLTWKPFRNIRPQEKFSSKPGGNHF